MKEHVLLANFEAKSQQTCPQSLQQCPELQLVEVGPKNLSWPIRRQLKVGPGLSILCWISINRGLDSKKKKTMGPEQVRDASNGWSWF